MPWFVYALICATLLSAASLLEKRALNKVHTIDYSATIAVINVFVSLPVLFFIDFSKISALALLLILIASIFGALAFYLVAKGTKHLEISTVSPLLSLAPGTTSLLAFLTLGEVLDKTHIIGIILMMIGSYILSMEPQRGIFEPFRFFARSRYIHFVFLSLLLYSCGAIIDRIIVGVFDVPILVYIFFSNLFISIIYAPIGLIFGGSFRGILRTFQNVGPEVFSASILSVGSRYFEMQSLRIASVGLISAIKRSSSFFVTLVGGELFHEKNIYRKTLASLVIIFGAILIVV